MSYPHWPSWPPWPSHSEHSSREIEHRLTTLEDRSDDHDVQHDAHRSKLDRHEKAILAIIGTLYVLSQDKFPALADLIRELIR